MGGMKSGSITDIDAITTMGNQALRTLYEQVFHRSAPKRARVELLRKNLVWAVQAHQQGHAPGPLRQSLINASHKLQINKQSVNYRAGTRLVREWQGQTYEITILDKGYLWQGKTYRSLTAIANTITGTSYSGPRFFGLKTGKNDDKP